ncbi:MAG: GTPase [Actinomycetota bacterium]
MHDLFFVLDLLDLAVAQADGLATEERREQAAKLAVAARRRRAFFTDSIIIALVGGTGSGKSSLLNAFAGEPVTSTSALRPHTDEPLAWVSAEDQPISSLLSDQGIDEIVEHDGHSSLAIVDLPDLDSINDQHRATVERILPLVDAVIWIFDPVKYHDPSIHEEFLSRLAGYEDVFVFVLNKVDRLDEGEAEAVVTHLTGLLELDGFSDPLVHRISADPPSGDPVDIDSLANALEERLVAKRADRAKLVEDLLQAGRSLVSDVGGWRGTPDDAHERIREAAADQDELAAELDELGITGPIADELAAAGNDADTVDRLLRRRAELAATIAALGVACAEIRAYHRKGTS